MFHRTTLPEHHPLHDININKQTIRDVISMEIGRQKRGWLNALGTVAKTVKGLATEEDIKVISQHVQQLGSLIQNNENRRRIVLTNMRSYEVASNRRMETTHL